MKIHKLNFIALVLFSSKIFAAPPAPTNVSAGSPTETSIQVKFKSSAERFEILRSLTNVEVNAIVIPFRPTAGNQNHTFTDTGLLLKTKYYYRVRACDNFGCSIATPSSNPPNSTTKQDTTKPSVTLTSPTHNSPASEPLVFTADASDYFGIKKVEFYLDNKKHTEVLEIDPQNRNYSVSSSDLNLSKGKHTVFARAFDNNQNFKDSTKADIFVDFIIAKAPPAAPATSDIAIVNSQSHKLLRWASNPTFQEYLLKVQPTQGELVEKSVFFNDIDLRILGISGESSVTVQAYGAWSERVNFSLATSRRFSGRFTSEDCQSEHEVRIIRNSPAGVMSLRTQGCSFLGPELPIGTYQAKVRRVGTCSECPKNLVLDPSGPAPLTDRMGILKFSNNQVSTGLLVCSNVVYADGLIASNLVTGSKFLIPNKKVGPIDFSVPTNFSSFDVDRAVTLNLPHISGLRARSYLYFLKQEAPFTSSATPLSQGFFLPNTNGVVGALNDKPIQEHMYSTFLPSHRNSSWIERFDLPFSQAGSINSHFPDLRLFLGVPPVLDIGVTPTFQRIGGGLVSNRENFLGVFNGVFNSEIFAPNFEPHESIGYAYELALQQCPQNQRPLVSTQPVFDYDTHKPTQFSTTFVKVNDLFLGEVPGISFSWTSPGLDPLGTGEKPDSFLTFDFEATSQPRSPATEFLINRKRAVQNFRLLTIERRDKTIQWKVRTVYKPESGSTASRVGAWSPLRTINIPTSATNQ